MQKFKIQKIVNLRNSKFKIQKISDSKNSKFRNFNTALKMIKLLIFPHQP